MDWSIYDDEVSPRSTPNGKYPAMTEEFESVNVPGLYIVG